MCVAGWKSPSRRERERELMREGGRGEVRCGREQGVHSLAEIT